MQNARETFLAQVRTPDLDAEVYELRQSLTTLKQEALEQVEKLDEAAARLVMPSLYEQIVQTKAALAGHAGLGVAMALAVLDEHHSNASLSRFDRELREQMSEMGESMAGRHGTRLIKTIARIEAQRLVWRHSHEFMSWLAFRRGDERYPAKDRLERLDAFGVQQRLLEARGFVMANVGVRLSASIEGADRFFLQNRWRLADSPDHALERYVWPLLSYQSAPTVKIERHRWEYDTAVESGVAVGDLEGERAKMAGMLEAQLADALAELPEAGYAGMI
ncbi:MAG: hypothetical protein AAF721_31960 [Myxococcota bacterium]